MPRNNGYLLNIICFFDSLQGVGLHGLLHSSTERQGMNCSFVYWMCAPSHRTFRGYRDAKTNPTATQKSLLKPQSLDLLRLLCRGVSRLVPLLPRTPAVFNVTAHPWKRALSAGWGRAWGG